MIDGVSAYDYVEASKYANDDRYKAGLYAILDNHRRTPAKKYIEEAHKEIYKHLTKDTTGIVMQYVEPVYPLATERPLKSFEFVNDEIW